ncbi:hypothetical protein [Raoultella terrigena]|uniref:hypothetical protein n=1 Tax=Raoultella terrigena TaxID=577 RepID=UPI0009772819|nr:hypothetical protein [Raoultella terrigena]OMP96503.1 hypothetical protein BZP36_01435 [Raoultella terrigena]
MAGVIEVRKDITLAPGVSKILYRSKTITDTTRSCIDASRAWAGGGKQAGYAVNDVVKDLCYTDGVATILGTAAYDGGGIKYTTAAPASGTPNINLPEAFYLPATCKALLLNLWVKVPSVYDNQAASGSRLILGVAKGANNPPTLTPANYHVGVMFNCNAAGSLNVLQVCAFGATVNSNALAAVQAVGGKGGPYCGVRLREYWREGQLHGDR